MDIYDKCILWKYPKDPDEPNGEQVLVAVPLWETIETGTPMVPDGDDEEMTRFSDDLFDWPYNNGNSKHVTDQPEGRGQDPRHSGQ